MTKATKVMSVLRARTALQATQDHKDILGKTAALVSQALADKLDFQVFVELSAREAFLEPRATMGARAHQVLPEAVACPARMASTDDQASLARRAVKARAALQARTARRPDWTSSTAC